MFSHIGRSDHRAPEIQEYCFAIGRIWEREYQEGECFRMPDAAKQGRETHGLH